MRASKGSWTAASDVSNGEDFHCAALAAVVFRCISRKQSASAPSATALLSSAHCLFLTLSSAETREKRREVWRKPYVRAETLTQPRGTDRPTCSRALLILGLTLAYARADE